MTDFFEKRRRSLENVKSEEAAGNVADSKAVRLSLMEDFHSGKKTLDQVQSELKKIKRDAKKNGQITRDKAYTATR